jgi:hypothetical protein
MNVKGGESGRENQGWRARRERILRGEKDQSTLYISMWGQHIEAHQTLKMERRKSGN